MRQQFYSPVAHSTDGAVSEGPFEPKQAALLEENLSLRTLRRCRVVLSPEIVVFLALITMITSLGLVIESRHELQKVRAKIEYSQCNASGLEIASDVDSNAFSGTMGAQSFPPDCRYASTDLVMYPC